MKGEFILCTINSNLFLLKESVVYIKSTLIKNKMSILLRCLVWAIELWLYHCQYYSNAI